MTRQQPSEEFFKLAVCIGITTMVVLPIFGPWVVLGSVASLIVAKAVLVELDNP